MGSNSSSSRKHNVPNVMPNRSQKPFVVVHQSSYTTGSTYNPRAYNHLNQPAVPVGFHRPVNNLNGPMNLNAPSTSKQSNADLNIKYTDESPSKTYNDKESSKTSETNKQYIFPAVPSELNNSNFNYSNVKEKYVKDSIDKEKVSYANSNESTKISAVSAPTKIVTEDDFITLWFSWKDEFLKYVKSFEELKNNKQKWGLILLNRLGPVGQEIYRTFTFEDNESREDIDVLLEKFDYYCLFRDTKRKNNEDIDKYVNNLKAMASKHSVDIDEILKKKILKEMVLDKFIDRAKSLIKNFSFPSSVKSLTLKEMTYIWMTYENLNYKQYQVINNIVRNCDKCARDHVINRCPAYGKKCNECNNENHFWTRCPSQYIDNCLYCGEAHFAKQCPAYMNKCSKCHKPNHFSWECSIPMILNCNNCGLSHIALKSRCSALNTICCKCFQRGHVPLKCKKKY